MTLKEAEVAALSILKQVMEEKVRGGIEQGWGAWRAPLRVRAVLMLNGGSGGDCQTSGETGWAWTRGTEVTSL